MKGLLNKSMWQFTVSTAIILICCSPLFFLVMKHFYAEDLDELIVYRSEGFISEYLPTFTIDEIESWNKYNEDIQIIEANATYPIDQVIQKAYYNKAEGHQVDYRIYYKKIKIQDNSYILISRIAMIEDKDLIGTLIGQYGILFLVLLVGMLFVQRILSKKLWKPFYTSLSKVDNFDIIQGNVPLFDDVDIKEFDRLNTILSNLISNNQKAYNNQKEFVQNASHELQTPLAVFQSKLDIFFQEPNLSENQVETIHSLYDILSRLTRLNKNLLLLARIDNNQFKEIENIDFKEVLEDQLDYLKILAESEGIAITTNFEAVILLANKILLESLINNLVINSIRHNVTTADAQIIITLSRCSFIIENTGEKQPLDSDKIFRGFSRTSENKKGNGLGLSIAYQVCKLHGWGIIYSYQNSIHRFEVKF